MLRALRRVKKYLKHDLKEIIAPSSLEYPPGEEELRKTQGLSWKALRLATKEYLDTWRSPKAAEPAAEGGKLGAAETPLMQDLAGIARAGGQGAKPLLQELYRTRASAYTSAVRQFVEGYREGYAGLPGEEGMPTSSTSSGPAGVQAAGQHTAAATALAGASLRKAEGHPSQRPSSPQMPSTPPAHGKGEAGGVESAAAVPPQPNR